MRKSIYRNADWKQEERTTLVQKQEDWYLLLMGKEENTEQYTSDQCVFKDNIIEVMAFSFKQFWNNAKFYILVYPHGQYMHEIWSTL